MVGLVRPRTTDQVLQGGKGEEEWVGDTRDLIRGREWVK